MVYDDYVENLGEPLACVRAQAHTHTFTLFSVVFFYARVNNAHTCERVCTPAQVEKVPKRST